MNAHRRYCAGSATVTAAAGGGGASTTSPVSFGCENNHSTARSASPFYENQKEVSHFDQKSRLLLFYRLAKCLAHLRMRKTHLSQHPHLLLIWLRTRAARTSLLYHNRFVDI